MFSFARVQAQMLADGIDGWLLCDYRGSNALLSHVLDIRRAPTRRAFLFIPKAGEPVLLIHRIDQAFFLAVDHEKRLYSSIVELHAALDALLGGTKRLALDYSPDCEIPNIAFADAGTVEFLRARGYEVVSSADLFQIGAMVWDEAALASHARASAAVAAVKDAAFGFVAEALRAGRRVTEHEVQSFIADALAHRGLEYEGVPVVQVNQHAGAIYYEPPAEGSAVISPGDWLLIDLWAREPGEENVYADIAWVAYAGRDVPTQMQRVFDIVRAARDAVIKALAEAWRLGDTLRGWQLDRVARDLITKHGYGDYFGHRTGHSMGPGKRLHGLGVNLDDFETHDTRRVLPGLGFSVEPGIYLPDFGVRLEVNVHFAPDTGPRVTTPLQTDIVRLL